MCPCGEAEWREEIKDLAMTNDLTTTIFQANF
jgi:hypothetical protein